MPFILVYNKHFSLRIFPQIALFTGVSLKQLKFSTFAGYILYIHLRLKDSGLFYGMWLNDKFCYTLRHTTHNSYTQRHGNM